MRACNLIGHKWDDTVWTPFAICERCGNSDEEDCDPIHVRAFWRVVWGAEWRIRKARLYLSKCRICGRRFDQHNDDCLPF